LWKIIRNIIIWVIHFRKHLIKINKKKISNLPNKEILEHLYNTIPMTKIAKQFNVSDTCIKKWVVKLNIPTFNRLGYWSKIGARTRN